MFGFLMDGGKLMALDEDYLRKYCVNLEYALKKNDVSDIDATDLLLELQMLQASVERSFSKLKLLKSYLRTTMSQERLNGLATLCIEKDILEDISYDDIIDDFASKNARRVRFK
ncbi:uncharacterized protein [Henckelia pumila]|uniref:uncharacterized protein n=1 Tax=Henckelia pumila TaxID=405737 RepID=UPI003C6E494D